MAPGTTLYSGTKLVRTEPAVAAPELVQESASPEIPPSASMDLPPDPPVARLHDPPSSVDNAPAVGHAILTKSGVLTVSDDEVETVSLFKKGRGRHVKWILGRVLSKDETSRDCQVQFLNSADDVAWEQRRYLPVWYRERVSTLRSGKTTRTPEESYSSSAPSVDWEPYVSTEDFKSVLLDGLILARHQLTLDSIDSILSLGSPKL